MAAKIVALVDRPSPKSMGMFGLVARQSDNSMTVSGVVKHHGRSISDPEFNQLRDELHILPVDAVPVPTFATNSTIAYWVGEAFREQASRHGVLLPVSPRAGSVSLAGLGTFWLDLPDAAYAAMQDWLRRSLCQVVRERNADLAHLMTWVAPDDDLTRAALWFVASSDAHRNDELAWFSRIDRDNGVSSNPDDLSERFAQLCERSESLQTRVVAVVGKMFSYSKRVAEALAYSTGASFTTFGAWFRDQAKARGLPDDIGSLQSLGHEVMETRSPTMLVLDVLASNTARGDSSSQLVIDGIRHQRALDALANLHGITVQTVGVRVDDAVRRQRLIAMNCPDPDRLLRHETEAEIDALLAHADMRPFQQQNAHL